MTKCPKCQKIYQDPTQFFCLEDGEKLVLIQSNKPLPTMVVGRKTVPVSETINMPVESNLLTNYSIKYYVAFAVAWVLICLLTVGALGFFILRGKSSTNKDIVANNNSLAKTDENTEVTSKAKPESNSNDALNLTDPNTLTEFKKQGVEVIDSNSSEISKPNPLVLIVLIDLDGKIFLNSQKAGNILGDNNLLSSLQQVFKEREKQNIYREGTKEVEKTVIIKTLAGTKQEIFDKTFKAIKESGASPIKVTGFLD